MTTFGSICSGIEAASVAFAPLGWKAAWFSEIEPFPSAVLAHHYPDVPNLGDMLTLAARIRSGEVSAPDVLCGGTPCQAFSVAGLRNSLDDARGNLSLTFCEIANEIDTARATVGLEPAKICWENVPGVLSTKDNAFGCFLAGLAGEDAPLIPPGGRWANAGYVLGPKRAIAWRTLDAQYFGLAQRRRRVFVVASAAEGFDPAEVLFEREGVRRDIAPSREQGQNTAGTLASRTTGGGFPGTDEACSGYLQPWVNSVCPTLRAGGNKTGGDRPPGTDVDTADSLVVVHGTQDPCVSQSHAFALGRNNGQENAVLSVALRGREGGATAELGDDIAGCLRASSGGGDKPHVLAPVAFDTTQITSAANYSNPKPGDACHPLTAGAHAPAIAYTTKLHNTGSNNAGKIFKERTTCLDANSPPPALLNAMQVRRLTPMECERLQGFPDRYTQIPWRGKPAWQCPDGPRYKALGNSWAVPCVYWIANRMDAQLKGTSHGEDS